MRLAILAPAGLAVAALAACGGDGGGVQPDADPATCLVEADLGAVTLRNQQVESAAGTSAMDPDSIDLTAALNGDPKPDLFFLQLFKGYGASTPDIHTGTFMIAGAELQYSTCGVCARVFTNYDPVTMLAAAQQYLATGGSVTITGITPNLTGSVADLTFEQVTIDNMTFMSTPVPDGCHTVVLSGSFDAVNTYTP